MFSLTNKIRYAIYLMITCLMIFAMLLGNSFRINKNNATELFDVQMQSEAYKKITIRTNDGVVLYDKGNFNNDKILRQSTFHLIGNTQGGVSTSLIYKYLDEAVVKQNHQYYQSIDKTLTIDSKIQKQAYLQLQNQDYSDSGCIIVLDYNTGEIKAMASTPSLDKNGNTIDYLNKTLCAFTPGSVVKSISVACALEKNFDTDFTYYCNTRNKHIKCSYAHGKVDLSRGLYKSCNCAMAEYVGNRVTPDELNQFVKKINLTGNNQIKDMPCYSNGFFDASSDYLWAISGQSKDMFTPIAVCKFYGILANQGKLTQPHILTDTKVESKQLISTQTCDFIKSSLENVVDNKLPIKAFGKTGTAELSNGKENHSWFVCSLEEGHTYTVLTFLEHGGSSLNAKAVTLDFINNVILKDGN